MKQKPPVLTVSLILLVLAPSMLGGWIWDYRCYHRSQWDPSRCDNTIRADGTDATDNYSNNLYTNVFTYTCKPGTAFDYGSKPNTLTATCGAKCANNTLYKCSGCNRRPYSYSDPKKPTWQYSFTGSSLPKCDIREYNISEFISIMLCPPSGL